MENDYNDTDNLIIDTRETNSKCYKHSSTIKFWFVISIVLCVISYILLDVDITVYYDSLNDKNIYIPKEYEYIYIYDILYGAWYLGIYIYIAYYYNNKNNTKDYYNIKCVYFLISIIYLANFVLHIVSYVDIYNKLKQNNMKMTNDTDNFIFYCISVVFNWIMTFLYLRYI